MKMIIWFSKSLSLEEIQIGLKDRTQCNQYIQQDPINHRKEIVVSVHLDYLQNQKKGTEFDQVVSTAVRKASYKDLAQVVKRDSSI